MEMLMALTLSSPRNFMTLSLFSPLKHYRAISTQSETFNTATHLVSFRVLSLNSSFKPEVCENLSKTKQMNKNTSPPHQTNQRSKTRFNLIIFLKMRKKSYQVLASGQPFLKLFPWTGPNIQLIFTTRFCLHSPQSISNYHHGHNQ